MDVEIDGTGLMHKKNSCVCALDKIQLSSTSYTEVRTSLRELHVAENINSGNEPFKCELNSPSNPDTTNNTLWPFGGQTMLSPAPSRSEWLILFWTVLLKTKYFPSATVQFWHNQWKGALQFSLLSVSHNLFADIHAFPFQESATASDVSDVESAAEPPRIVSQLTAEKFVTALPKPVSVPSSTLEASNPPSTVALFPVCTATNENATATGEQSSQQVCDSIWTVRVLMWPVLHDRDDKLHVAPKIFTRSQWKICPSETVFFNGGFLVFKNQAKLPLKATVLSAEFFHEPGAVENLPQENNTTF